MLSLRDHWLWDFWIADDGTAYHLFFLKAPRVGDPGQRHWNVRIGHAISADLLVWELLGDAIRPSSTAAFDDFARVLEAGHGVRRSSSIRATAENGCPASPVGLTNRLPSK